MSDTNSCPKCKSVETYAEGNLWICPACSNEWMLSISGETAAQTEDNQIRDANRNILVDGDSVIVVKDLKIKGATSVIKGGTKIKNIRLTDTGDGHNIACKIDG